MREISLREINPLVRCAGTNRSFTQQSDRIAYDNRLFYTLSGSGRVAVNGTPYNMERYALAVVPAGVPFRVENVCRHELSVINYDLSQDNYMINKWINSVPAEDFDPRMLVEDLRLTDCPALRGPLYIEKIPEVSEYIAEIIRLYCAVDEASRLMMSALLKLTLGCAIKRAVRSRGGAPVSDRLAREVADYIGAHCAEPLTNASIAERFHYHPSFVNRAVSSYTGMPLHRYLTTVRLARAMTELAENGRSVEETARLCGFQDAKNFTKSFRARYGFPPSQARSSE